MLAQDRELAGRAAQIEQLVDDIETCPDEAARATMTSLAQGLLAMYGEGLERMLTIIGQHCDEPTSNRLLEALAGDQLIAHLLLVHDLHPVPVAVRVARALDEVRPYLKSHGGDVELLKVEGGVAWLRMQGSCNGCPSSTATLKQAIETAIQQAAPDLESIEAEGVAASSAPSQAFVPAASLRRREQRPVAGEPAWTIVGALPQLADGGATTMEVGAVPVLFLKLDGTLYAYRDRCPGCGQPLGRAILRAAELSCAGCAHTYDVRAAGRCLDSPDMHLEPVPLLSDVDGVRVAVSTGSEVRVGV